MLDANFKMKQYMETIAVNVEPVSGGFFVDSDDLPTLNLFVQDVRRLLSAIEHGVKYLYRHNRKMEVSVFFDRQHLEAERMPPISSPSPPRTIGVAYSEAA